MTAPAEAVAWHDLEYGGYREDLPVWRELALECGEPVLEIGAGTGRVSLDLARRGHHVTALDRQDDLLAALDQRAGRLPVTTVRADARDFSLPGRYGLCMVPMQTLQLLGGGAGRQAFFACVGRHLQSGGTLAAAIVTELEQFEVAPGMPAPLPDMVERDGVLWWSQPTAVRVARDHFTLERRREIVTPDGRRETSEESIRLDRVAPAELEAEAAQAGLRPLRHRRIAATTDYAGSEVVILGA